MLPRHALIGEGSSFQVMAKIDTTGGAFTSADYDDRWNAHSETVEQLRLTSAALSVQREAAGYRFEYWINPSQTAVPWYIAVVELGGPLVGFFSFGKHGDVLLANEVAVRKAYRRKGIASAMYNLGEHVTRLKFAPCTPHSPYAAAFWANRSALTL
jgi:GNAT superfamily N-acetyltransferase